MSTLDAEIIRRLVDLQMTSAQLMGVINILERIAAPMAERRRKQAEATKRHREHVPISESEWWKLTEIVRERDENSCRYCGALSGRMSIDHVIPVSRGGKHDLSNLVLACTPCNSSKRDKTLEEWRGR